LARNIGKQFTDTTLCFLAVQGKTEIEDDEDGASRKISRKKPEDDGSVTSHDTTNTYPADFPNLKEYTLFNHHGILQACMCVMQQFI
jgi:hypothetical protein